MLLLWVGWGGLQDTSSRPLFEHLEYSVEHAEHLSVQDYLSTTLAQELSRQLNPLGGFAVPSRDEENQLTTDFPDEVRDSPGPREGRGARRANMLLIS